MRLLSRERRRGPRAKTIRPAERYLIAGRGGGAPAGAQLRGDRARPDRPRRRPTGRHRTDHGTTRARSRRDRVGARAVPHARTRSEEDRSGGAGVARDRLRNGSRTNRGDVRAGGAGAHACVVPGGLTATQARARPRARPRRRFRVEGRARPPRDPQRARLGRRSRAVKPRRLLRTRARAASVGSPRVAVECSGRRRSRVRDGIPEALQAAHDVVAAAPEEVVQTPVLAVEDVVGVPVLRSRHEARPAQPGHPPSRRRRSWRDRRRRRPPRRLPTSQRPAREPDGRPRRRSRGR